MSSAVGSESDPLGVVHTRIGGPDEQALIARHRELARHESGRYRGRIPSLKLSITAAEGVVIVGCVGSSDVGSLVAIPESTSEWLICHVFVEEDFREIGVADALVSNALAELETRGVRHVRAYAQPGDRSLKNLFERHGLVAETITVGRALGS